MMRLLKEEKDALLEAVARYDSKADVYLFGSRTDDAKKGGDIDILIISDKLGRDSLFDIEEDVFCRIEEQKIDFILSDRGLSNKFAKMIFKRGVIKL